MLKADLKRTSDLIKGSKVKKIIGCYRSPGCHAMVILRFGQWLQTKNLVIRSFLEPVYMFLYHRIRSKWGIEIPRVTQIGAGFYIGHSGGIVISGLAKIGKNVNISQQVTIGVAGKGDKRGVPTIGDNVYIAPGAKIFGKITIGNNVSIGANTVVHKDIPDGSIVVLDPGFTILPRSTS